MKAMAAVMAFVAGEAMNVSQVCRECGITPKTFYKYAGRCRLEGLAGFEARSRRPLTSPARTPVVLEDAIVALRKELAEDGHDHGAATIQWHLGRDRRFGRAVPSVATVHRILQRRGFVTPQPHKRPKGSWCRFEAPAPNEMWQIDATGWTIATGVATVFNIVDDHSRVVCRSRAVQAATGEAAWITFCEAAQRWGFPAGVLSDNGLCFSGKLRGFEVLFEANLRDGGIRPITGRGYHPQTTGKVERFQQTLKKWLRHKIVNVASPPISMNSRPVSMSSVTTTTPSDPIKASDESHHCPAGKPAHPQALATRCRISHHDPRPTPLSSMPAATSTCTATASTSVPLGLAAPSP